MCLHSPVHEKVIFCQFLTFLEALKDVGLALHKFEDGIRTFEHKEMGHREKNGEIGQFLAESNHTNAAADIQAIYSLFSIHNTCFIVLLVQCLYENKVRFLSNCDLICNLVPRMQATQNLLKETWHSLANE